MSPEDRAREFCQSAFGPFGVEVAPYAAIVQELIEGALEHERNVIAEQARIWAGHYPEASDGRNTFVLLAEWIEKRGLNQQQSREKS